jgi:spore photoproduct lyase
MNFELERVVIEQEFRSSALTRRVLAGLPASVTVEYVDDGRAATRPDPQAADPFATGKRRLVLMRRRSPFVMACPAGGGEFACCGYQVMALASNCPMDCSYCFLQEYVANNPAFQIYANYTQAFDELAALTRRASGNHLRVGTGEWADSLAWDKLTGLSLELVDFFSRQQTLLLEFKTKTDEIENLLRIDPKGQVLVSWSLSPAAVYRASEHRSAPPAARIAAARRLCEAGYRIAFHLDPVIAYEQAQRDYLALLDELFATIDPRRIAFISLGGLRMTPALRTIARRRFPADPMLAGEEVLAPDGRYRTFVPLRAALLATLVQHIRARRADLLTYLCMESATMSERVLGAPAARAATLGARLASG